MHRNQTRNKIVSLKKNRALITSKTLRLKELKIQVKSHVRCLLIVKKNYLKKILGNKFRCLNELKIKVRSHVECLIKILRINYVNNIFFKKVCAIN